MQELIFESQWILMSSAEVSGYLGETCCKRYNLDV